MSFYLQTNIGNLDLTNKYCIDWNSAGLFAFANNYTINLVDAFSFKVLIQFICLLFIELYSIL